MSLSLLHDVVNTGSVVKLTKEFVDHLFSDREKHYPGRDWWEGEFTVNVIPQPCEGEEVEEYKVEFTGTPASSPNRKPSKTGFALKMRPNNTYIDPSGTLGGEDIQVIGEKIA